MNKKKVVLIISTLMILSLVFSFLIPAQHAGEDLKASMRDAVLHEHNQVSLFGLTNVHPALISAFVVTGILGVFALIVRIFFIPKFKLVPGKFQLFIESAVEAFANMAKANSPHRNRFLGLYIFVSGTYIFVGTLFELFGAQIISTKEVSIALPAPLSDINAAIAMGFLSYLIIVSAAVLSHGVKGIGKALKDFSLPISMSFRLFGALLSGLLVTELVYHFVFLSFVFPVVIGVLFTLLHAVIQAYVLTMLTALFYGEMSEVSEKEEKLKA